MNPEEVGEIWFSWANVLLWTIPSFQILEQKRNTRIWSPPFSKPRDGLQYASTYYYSSTDKRKIPEGFVCLVVYSKDLKESPSKCVQFGVVNDGNVEINRSSGQWNQYYKRFNVSEFMRLDALTGQSHVFCEVIDETKCDTVNASSTDKTNCEIKNAAVQIIENKESEDHTSKQCSNKSHRNLEKLSQNFKDLYIQEQDTDLVLKVKDHEFKAHKLILRSRSPVFNAMFSHGLLESTSGIVPIEDCEPAAFEEFLLFVYTGKTEHLSSDSVCELYYVADKYQIPELKEECVNLLGKSLSIETICDVICLSTKHNEKELLDLAIHFFARNMEEIILTVKWQSFLKENTIEANELTIKALKIGFTKRNF